MKRIILAVGLLWASPSFAANKLYISEYAAIGVASGIVAQIASEPNVTDQIVDFSSGVASSSAFNSQTSYSRLMCDSRCSIKVRPGCAGSSAATSNKPMAADSPEYFGVRPGDCVSVIANP